MSEPPARLTLGRVRDLLPVATAHGTGWLSACEQARLDRLNSSTRRAQFLSGRWLARHTLAAVHGGDPAAWVLSAPDHGPPEILTRPADVHVHACLGLSHSGDHVVCTVSATPMGVDLESPQRERNVVAMARIICTPGERLRLSVEEGLVSAADFYELWTLKEAWIKRGAGAASPDRMSRIHTQRASAGCPSNARLWHCEGLTLAAVGDALGELLVSGLPSGCGEPGDWTVEETLPLR